MTLYRHLGTLDNQVRLSFVTVGKLHKQENINPDLFILS